VLVEDDTHLHWKLVWRRHSSRHSLNDRPVISEWNSPPSRELR